MRDTKDIIRIGLPVFSRGRIPIGPLKVAPELREFAELDVPIEFGGVTAAPGMWIFGDADGVLFVHAADLDAIAAQCVASLASEAAITEQIQAGESLAALLGVEEFLAERGENPEADFNEHLARRRNAI